MTTLRHGLLALIMFALITSSTGCGATTSDTDATDRATPIEAGGVRVSASFQTPTLVRVRFEPLEAGFHLYSLALPAEGVDGLGVPTRVEAGPGLTTSGPAESTIDEISLRIPELNVTLPVYPDGPVDIVLPVTQDHPDNSTVVVTYGACSDDVCLIPVRDLTVPVI